MGTAVQVGTKTNLTSEVEELICETLQDPGPYTLMNPKDTYPSMPNIIVRTLFLAFEKLWRWEDVSENWKKAIIIPVNELLKKGPGNYRPITLTSSLQQLRNMPS